LSYLLKNARIDASSQLYHLLIDGNKIASCIANDQQISPINCEEWDLQGKIVLPGLVETHAHLDKTYTPAKNPTGTLIGAIETMAEYKQQRSVNDLQINADRAIRQAIRMGVTHLRSHIDIGSESDLERLDALVDTIHTYKNAIDIQLTSLTDMSTQSGKDLVAKALTRGVDVIGGAPALSKDPQKAVNNAVLLAQQTGAAIDLHLDENSDPNSTTLEHLADLIINNQWQGPVSASHCCSLSFMPEQQRKLTIDKVAQAAIDIITLPACNLVLIGREFELKPRGATAVKQLLAAGVNVAVGSDNVQDPFNPFGNYDPLASAQINAQVAQMTSLDELYTAMKMVMGNAAQALRLNNYGIQAQCQANLVVVDTTDYLSAITAIPNRLATFFNGSPVVRTDIKEDWSVNAQMSATS
jgi:cytosine deaminase